MCGVTSGSVRRTSNVTWHELYITDNLLLDTNSSSAKRVTMVFYDCFVVKEKGGDLASNMQQCTQVFLKLQYNMHSPIPQKT